MKKILSIPIAAILLFSVSANAQREGHGGNNNNRGGRDNGGARPSIDRAPHTAPQREVRTAPAPRVNQPVRQPQSNRPPVAMHNNAPQQRHDPGFIRNSPTQRNFNNNRIVYNNNRYVYNRPDYRRPYSYVGQRYTTFYGPRFSTPYHGINYYYSGGFFYRPYDSYFQIVLPPIGIRIFALPYGYRRYYIGPDPYYYYGGTYYRNYGTYYEVVDAPMGSILPELPTGTKQVVINGQNYFELNGTYYMATLRGAETWYTVVGKNGVLNTDPVNLQEDTATANVGDVVTDLPDNCKTVVLGNQKYYVVDDVYYQEQIADNNITYRVVAKP